MDTQKSSRYHKVFVGAIAILVLALVPAALAAKGGNGGGGTSATGSLAIAGPAGAAATNPQYGDTVSFTGTFAGPTGSKPNVELVCTQGTTVVYASLSGWYETSFANGAFLTRNLTLSSQAWTGGSATCTATLYFISGLTTVKVATLPVTVS